MGTPSRWSSLAIAHPVVLAPMGGVGTPALAAAVSKAGGLGSLGVSYSSPAEILADAAEVRALGGRLLNLNLFAGAYDVAAAARAEAAPMLAILGEAHAALGLPPPALPALPQDPFAAQLDAVLEARPDVFSFTFGIPSARDLARVREEAILPFPLQNALTRPMRAAAGKQGDAGHLSLWAGQGVARIRALPAAALVATLVEELVAAPRE